MVELERVEHDYQIGQRFRGRCKVWTAGHGFLKREDGGKDVFVHHTQLQMHGHRSLQIGELVEFEIQRKLNGKVQAVRVTRPFGIELNRHIQQHQSLWYPHSIDARFRASAPGMWYNPLISEQKRIGDAYPTRRFTGKCRKWGKGYGFIERDDGREDVFVHQSQVQKKGYRTLLPGEPLEFEVETKSNGQKQAVRVTGPGGEDVIGGKKSYREIQDRQQQHLLGLSPYMQRSPVCVQKPAYPYQMENVVSPYASQRPSWQRSSSCRNPYQASDVHSYIPSLFQFPSETYAADAARKVLSPHAVSSCGTFDSFAELYKLENLTLDQKK